MFVQKGKVVCKKSVVMENGEHAGQEAFTAGKEYQVSSVSVFDRMLTITAVDNFGSPHSILTAYVHPADTKFDLEYFEH